MQSASSLTISQLNGPYTRIPPHVGCLCSRAKTSHELQHHATSLSSPKTVQVTRSFATPLHDSYPRTMSRSSGIISVASLSLSASPWKPSKHPYNVYVSSVTPSKRRQCHCSELADSRLSYVGLLRHAKAHRSHLPTGSHSNTLGEAYRTTPTPKP